ncbi:MAG TPA: hypothetical protein VGR31_05880 [Planctomycetota bacterium]|nr:hypothetical protein [Planctomycetota bacterium]
MDPRRFSVKWLAVAALAAVSARGASAQTPCQGSSGPDVIVGDITGPANYTAVGTREALSLGTTSCNQGTAPLDWHASNNHHPVIGGELYRFRVVDGAGRFEQVGLSWLKHGFYAESQNLCCNNCQPTDGTILGIGCSDPYVAGRNGTQSLLGPRYQVDAHTGVFVYPPPHPSGGNTGRIEAEIADLEPSSANGTRYFGNCQYVAADDASSNNANNNSSYREITVSGSGTTWNFGFVGSVRREQPAIQAWQVCESGVTTTDVQIPNDGLLILGAKATDLGGGMFHYEYALYNMNVDVSVGQFTVPVPSDVSVTNVGFHGVVYRGGDGIGGVNRDGSDWTPARASSALAWSTATFAQDPNANAIRWGTTYTFRFDANSAPASGTVRIGTFKTAGAVTATADVPGGSHPSGTPFCFGDGNLATACPCGNSGTITHGCENSSLTGGAFAFTTGALAPDTLVIHCAGERETAYSLFIQGDASHASGNVFGDGVRCVGGSLKRIGVKPATAGVATYPEAGDLGIRARSAALGDVIPPGGVRYYQVYYRDPDATFCAPPIGGTFNVSSGLIVAWP